MSKNNYPVYISPKGKEYTCIGWACDAFRSGWEWYAFEETEDEGVYFGFVHGFEDEFGYFDIAELKENKIKFFTDIESLNEIAPPIGWKRK